MQNQRGNINGPNGQSGSLQFRTVTADYTITEIDAGAVVEVDSPDPVVITLEANAPASGFYCEVVRVGAGTVQFAAGPGATVLSSAGATPSIAAQQAGATITKRAAASWRVQGAIP